MFDDQTPLPPSTNVPKNLPLGEPDDLFADAETPPETAFDEPPAKANSANVAFVGSASRPSAVDAGVLRPKRENSSSSLPLSEARASSSAPRERVSREGDGERDFESNFPGLESPPASSFKEPMFHRKFVWIAVVLVMTAIVAGGAWWIYASFIQKDDAPENFGAAVSGDAASNTAPENTAPAQAENESAAAESARDTELLFGETLDSDEDQLDNAVEATLGTDKANWDSDSDGLGDGDEVLVWKTNPLLSDTDGDSYKDGDEVKAGYSPLGTGRLLEIPKESSS